MTNGTQERTNNHRNVSRNRLSHGCWWLGMQGGEQLHPQQSSCVPWAGDVLHRNPRQEISQRITLPKFRVPICCNRRPGTPGDVSPFVQQRFLQPGGRSQTLQRTTGRPVTRCNFVQGVSRSWRWGCTTLQGRTDVSGVDCEMGERVGGAEGGGSARGKRRRHGWRRRIARRPAENLPCMNEQERLAGRSRPCIGGNLVGW